MKLLTKLKRKDVDTICLIDYSQAVMSGLFGTVEEKGQITLQLVRYLSVNAMRNALITHREFGKIHLVLCLDSKTTYWRKKFASYYKANRKKTKADGPGADWDWGFIYDSMSTVTDEIKKNFDVSVVHVDSAEADDVIGTLCQFVHDKYPKIKMIINSTDGDFTQLQVYPNVSQWSTVQRKWVEPKHGGPTQDLRYKIVKGDPKDTVSSITAPSDWLAVKEKSQKSKPISKKDLLLPIIYAKNESEIYNILEKAELISRYKENKTLIDLRKTPFEIKKKIVGMFLLDELGDTELGYDYLLKHKLGGCIVQLCY